MLRIDFFLSLKYVEFVKDLDRTTIGNRCRGSGWAAFERKRGRRSKPIDPFCTKVAC